MIAAEPRLLESALPVEPRTDIEFLWSALPTDEHRAHIEAAFRPELRLDLDYSFLGFLSDYWHYAQVLRDISWERTLVVDIGCCAGFHSVFFQGCLGYVGIDRSIRACKALTPNVQFWEGAWESREVQERLTVFLAEKEREVDRMPRNGLLTRLAFRPVGIANMSLLYSPSKTVGLSLMHQRFDRLFIH